MKENNQSLTEIIHTLHREEVIAYPTEAVFGLGCDPDSEKAVSQLCLLKQRPWQKGVILIAADYKQLQRYINDTALNAQQYKSVIASWPGPVTWIMPARSDTPRWLSGGHFGSIAVRVSDHPLVQQLCKHYGKPLVSTSANISGCYPCRTEAEIRVQFGFSLPLLSGCVGSRMHPSAIRDALTGNLLRQG